MKGKGWQSLLLSAIGVASVVGTAKAEAPPPGRRLTIVDCVRIALERNPDAANADREVDATHAARGGVAGQFAPRLVAEGNVQQYTSPFDLACALPGTPGPPPVLRVRDAFTWTGTVSIVQPLTNLFQIYDQYKVEDMGVDVASIERDATRRDVAFSVGGAFLRLLEAMRLADVADASVAQLEAQSRQAQSQFNNGVIGKNDLLRAQLALATARQRVIQARGQIVLARGRLGSLMGVSPDMPIDPVPVDVDAVPASDEPTVESAEAHAVANRAEIREVDRKIVQADSKVAVARSKLFPQVSAVASYVHVEGSAFQQKDAAYAGLIGTWNVWDWGATSSGISEADARREQARIARSKIEDQVRMEARQAFVDQATAKEALEVAKTAVEQAEENFRIVTKRFENAASTSFDVVDAESLLTQARAQVENARYEYLIAIGSLQRATGSPLPHL
jgi:outer membrane protein